MILNDEDIKTRLESPLNLINRLNSVLPRHESMGIFKPSEDKTQPSSTNEELDTVVDEKKLRLGLVRNLALEVLHGSLTQLNGRITEVRKPRDLSRIARDMKAVMSEDEGNNKNISQVIIYKPIVNDINKYDTLVVVE